MSPNASRSLSGRPGDGVGLRRSACRVAFDGALVANGAPGAKGNQDRDRPTLTVYLPSPELANGAAVVVCPGGGYGALAIDHEGHAIAKWLNGFGVAAAIIDYRQAYKTHTLRTQYGGSSE